jgi:hypothetical protein
VLHPLWRADSTLLSKLGVAFPGSHTLPIDTFDLERRPLRALEMAGGRPLAPSVTENAAAG